jgi:hypothetical protein
MSLKFGKRSLTSNVKDLVSRKGKIGKSTPQMKRKARQLALAISYNKQRGS